MDTSLSRSAAWRLFRWSCAATVVAALLSLAWRLLVPHPASAPHARVLVAHGPPLRVAPVLPMAAGIFGTVTANDGRAVANARVCATCASCDVTESQLQSCATSNGVGNFALTALSPIGYRVVAIAPGFAPGRAENGGAIFLAAGESKRGVDIRLARDGVELSGIVLDALGGPVASADVRAIRWEGAPSAITVQSAADGRFTLYVPKGGTTLVASADGYTSARLMRTAPSRDVRLVLTPAASASGIVIDSETGRPVEGASVRAQRFGFTITPSQHATLTGPDGRFRVDQLDAGKYVFDATAAGYRGQSDGAVVIGLAQAVDGITIAMAKAAQINGRVVIGDKREPCREGLVELGPIPPAFAARAPADAAAHPATTSAFSPIASDGGVHFDAVPPGYYYARIGCIDHALQKGPEFVAVASADVNGLEWQVEAGVGLAILALDENNRPLPGAEVAVVMQTAEDAAGERSTLQMMPITMNQEGRYRTPANLEPGHYSLKPHNNYQGEALELDLKNGMGIVDATVRFAGQSGLIARVKSTSGEAIDGLLVEAFAVHDGPAPAADGSQVLTARALGGGEYAFSPVEPGAYRVEVRDERNPVVTAAQNGVASIQVPRGASVETTVVLARDGVLSGRVVDAEGNPVADAWVSIEREEIDLSHRVNARMLRTAGAAGRVMSDRDGRFRIDQLATQGMFDVHAEYFDGRSTLLHGVQAGADVTLQLPHEQLAKPENPSGDDVAFASGSSD